MLILAGITISFLFGENGIIAKAQIAKDTQERAKVEEMLNLKYLDKMIDGRGKVSSNVLTTIFNELEKEGYEVEQRGDAEVKGLLFQDSTGNNVDTLNIEQDTSIIVRISLITENGSNTKSYVKIGNKYYEIIAEGKITLAKEGLDKLEGISHNIKITKPASGIIIKTKLDDNSEETEITEGSPIASETSLILSAGSTVGDYTFNVKVENSSYKADVTAHVVANGLYATGVTISSAGNVTNVMQGENLQLTATKEPVTSTDEIEWSITEGSSLATIDETGEVTVNEETTVGDTITVTAKAKRGETETGVKGTFTITVTSNLKFVVTSVTVTPSTLTYTLGDTATETLTATVQPSTASQDVTWSSGNEAVARIDENRKIILMGGTGEAKITATSVKDSTMKGTCTITVEQKETVAELTYLQTENKQVEDIYGNKITVPQGFKVLANNTEDTTNGIAKVEYKYTGNGIPSVQDGIVIADSDNNQFVWIPVGTIKNKAGDTAGETTEIELGRYTFSTSSPGTPTLVQSIANYDKTTTASAVKSASGEVLSYRIEGYCYELATANEGIESSGTNGLNTTAKDLKGFKESVEANGGYYIARYEASYGSGTSATDYKPLSKISKANSTSSMSYTNRTLWNFITQNKAAHASRNMYSYDSTKASNVDINGNKVGAESDLINSYAWDTAIVYIQKMGNTNYANATRDTTGNTNLKNTGKTGDVKCNIYDMAANENEWTTEYSAYTGSSYARPCVYRGGFCSDSFFYTAYRGYNAATYSDYNLSFRAALYVK